MGPSFKYITASRVGPNLNHRPNRLGKKRLKAFFRRKLYIIESVKTYAEERVRRSERRMKKR
jgi:hypothetical protein